MFSVVIPVYRNEESIPALLESLRRLALDVRQRHGDELEAVFVVDGSPDQSHLVLERALPQAGFRAQLVRHSRNFGSFAAIRTGLATAAGDRFGVIAADLQEPPELLLAFLDLLASGDYDVVVGCRETRDDPLPTRLASALFWRLYRLLVIRDMPARGVDVFGCTRAFRDQLLRLEEANSSLVGLLFWLGFRRAEVPYHRRARQHGRSAWTLGRKVSYLFDSVFSFTDLPVRLLTALGALGLVVSIVFGSVVVLLKLLGQFDVPGYAATVIVVMFFGAINMLGLGIVGSYAWRGYENTKRRPLALVAEARSFPAAVRAAEPQPARGPQR